MRLRFMTQLIRGDGKSPLQSLHKQVVSFDGSGFNTTPDLFPMFGN